MSPEILFQTHLVLGYAAWLLCFDAYLLPKLREMGPIKGLRSIAMLHAFRFFGLVFILPGVVGPGLPEGFGPFAAYADLATGLLAMLALLSYKRRPLFLAFTIAFNAVGLGDILADYYHAVRGGLPEVAGQLGAAYAIPVLYVPLLVITHVTAFYLLTRLKEEKDRDFADKPSAGE